MIRINLLGLPRPKKGKRGGGGGAAMPSMGGGEGGPGFIVFLVIGLILGLGGWYYLYNQADKKAKDLATKVSAADVEGKRLAEVKVKFEKRQDEAKNFEKRVKVIDQLRENQAGPVKLLTAVGNTVNNTDAIWLNTMSETGNTVNIDGMALSTNAVANLITNLKNTGYFKSVDFKDTTQDTQTKDMQAFTFTITCEKVTAQAAAPSAAPAPKS